ncbi:MAG: hypothetical protein LBD71_01715 [Treponema sp.]|jgi:hypothetical protein|nr:hypothetical protein [Treponema sp.]
MKEHEEEKEIVLYVEDRYAPLKISEDTEYVNERPVNILVKMVFPPFFHPYRYLTDVRVPQRNF